MFEIHEKEEGPPKKLKSSKHVSTADDEIEVGKSDQILNCADDEADLNSLGEERVSTSRRNAVYSKLAAANLGDVEFGPANLPSNTVMTSGFGGFGSVEENEYVGLINQAMTCYLNSLIQALFMTPEFRNGIYR